MLRQITKSVLISKIREDNLMNSKNEWNYFCRPKDYCNATASLLLEVIFHALLSSLCYFEYCDDQLKRSLYETSFCESPYKCNCVLKSGNKLNFFSLPVFTETL